MTQSAQALAAYPTDVRPAAKPVAVAENANVKLQVEGLHKRYGDHEVLKGVSLNARNGDVISLIGASGSGKSTMLRCINFLEQPDAGVITLDGISIEMQQGRAGTRAPHQAQLQNLRTRLAMVFQHFNLWSHMTVLENITMAPRRVLGVSAAEAEKRARLYLDKVGLPGRVVAMEPEIILFDEPTSALDPELVGEVLKVIQTLAEEGRTMLMVTHEMGFARQVSSQVLFLHQGRVEEQGAAEILDQPNSERLQQFLSNRLK